MSSNNHFNYKQELPTPATVVFLPSGRRGKFPTGITLLEAARQLGEPIESICGGHVACGKCQVQIEQGTFPKPNSNTNSLTAELSKTDWLSTSRDA